MYIYIYIYIYAYTYIYIYIPRGPTEMMFRSKARNSCSTYVIIIVTVMLTISHNMQHAAGCPTWGQSHPNRCWVSKWEHG